MERLRGPGWGSAARAKQSRVPRVRPVAWAARLGLVPAVAALALLLAGCALQVATSAEPRRAAAAARAATAVGSLDARYRAAILDAAVFRPDHVRRLRAVPDPPPDRILVVTWTDFRYPGPPDQRLERDIWVTLTPEVQERCRGFEADKKLRLEQLLGLPPGTGKRTFVTLRLDPRAMFRPCPDPSPTAPRCGSDFPAGVSAAHAEWIGRTALGLWRIPGGYPWTRLGYTYDWHPGSDRYGASEYIAPRGTPVQVVAREATDAYCAPAP